MSKLTKEQIAIAKAQIQYVFLSIEDANDSDLELGPLTVHDDNTMTFPVFKWEGMKRNFITKLEFELKESDKESVIF